jgi:HSP20 family protein
MNQISEMVRRRAYEFFDSRGCRGGDDLGDWFRAEAELLRPVPVDIVDTQTQLTVRAELPGFNEREIEVGVEPRLLLISASTQGPSPRATEATVYSERSWSEVFRSIELPTEIEPSKVTATLKDGLLQITLPKVAVGEPLKVKVQAA